MPSVYCEMLVDKVLSVGSPNLPELNEIYSKSISTSSISSLVLAKVQTSAMAKTRSSSPSSKPNNFAGGVFEDIGHLVREIGKLPKFGKLMISH